MAGDPPRTSAASRQLLVWDREGRPPKVDGATALWRCFHEDPLRRVFSVPAYVERSAEEFRSRYLAWVYELGQAVVNGRRLVDWLEIRPSFSYWWVTPIAERFNMPEDSRINDAIKAMALEEIVAQERIERIVLESDNADLAAALEQYAGRAEVAFLWMASNAAPEKISSRRKAFSALPHTLRAMVYLSWQLRKYAPRRRAGRARPSLTGRLTFVDTLVHLEPSSLSSMQFASNYWTLLVGACRTAGVRTNWLHNYFAQRSIPSTTKAEGLLQRFNECSDGMESHALFESNLSIPVARSAFRDIRRLSAVTRRLAGVEKRFAPMGSLVNFWPLFKRELIDSLRGNAAMANCLRLSLYEATLRAIPRQHRGIYIQENQGWEVFLLHAWRAAGHGEIIGMQHTTVRFWDLRYFYDPRTYDRTGNDLPRPDLVAVNGPVADRMYVSGGYPAEELVRVEALRYLHPVRTVERDRPIIRRRGSLNVLICGEFLVSATQKMLAWLKVAARSLPDDTAYVFKPHPAYPIDLSGYDGAPLEVTDDPMADLLPWFDVVFAGNNSSTAADAYCAGVPVVQILEGKAFNLSPLRGLAGETYVTQPSELAKALRDAGARPSERTQFFYLDPALPQWTTLLGIPPETASPESGSLTLGARAPVAR